MTGGLEDFCFIIFELEAVFLYVCNSNKILGFHMHHGGISVMKCFSILLGLIFDASKSGEIRRPKGFIALGFCS